VTETEELVTRAVGDGWCFSHRAGHRFHLASTHSPHLVWLERYGHRVFEPTPPLDPAVYGSLERCLGDPATRHAVEQAWISRHLLYYGSEQLDLIWQIESSFAIVVYPQRRFAFRRNVALRWPHSAEHASRPQALRPHELRLTPDGTLHLWEHGIPLSALLWGPCGDLQRAQLHRLRDGELERLQPPFELWATTRRHRPTAASMARPCRVSTCTARVSDSESMQDAEQHGQALETHHGEHSSWQVLPRTLFVDAARAVLRRALTLHLRGLLTEPADLSVPTLGGAARPHRRLTRLLETEWVPLAAAPSSFAACERAYAEIVNELRHRHTARARHIARTLAHQDLDNAELTHCFDPDDDWPLWRQVDELLARARALEPSGRPGLFHTYPCLQKGSLPTRGATRLFEGIGGQNWGWIEGAEPMHIRTLDERPYDVGAGADTLTFTASAHSRGTGSDTVHVWLEHRGRRAFELASGALSPTDLERLRTAVNARREEIERRWLLRLTRLGRLTATLQGSVIELTAYPGSPHQFMRQLDLRREFPGAYGSHRSWDEYPPRVDWDYSNGLLAVGSEMNIDDRNHFELDFVFED
jgi:hypothetical protein